MVELSRRVRIVLGVAAVGYALVSAVLLSGASGDEATLLALVSVVTFWVLVLGAAGSLDHNTLLLGGALVLALLGVYQARAGNVAIAVGTIVASAVVFLRYARHSSGDLDPSGDG